MYTVNARYIPRPIPTDKNFQSTPLKKVYRSDDPAHFPLFLHSGQFLSSKSGWTEYVPHAQVAIFARSNVHLVIHDTRHP
jgi:hypothetical protein